MKANKLGRNGSNGLQGLIAAPFTAFSSSGDLDSGLIEPQARFLADNGVRGAFVCGTTGEGFSLSTEERMELPEHWAEVAPKELKVAHATHNSFDAGRKLAVHAQRIGASAIASIGSAFLLPASVEHLVDFCAPLIPSTIIASAKSGLHNCCRRPVVPPGYE